MRGARLYASTEPDRNEIYQIDLVQLSVDESCDRNAPLCSATQTRPSGIWILLAGQLVHLVLVMMPTWMLLLATPFAKTDHYIIGFAASICLASFVEAIMVARCVSTTSGFASERVGITDPIALQVAQLVGVLLLLHSWAGQLEHQFFNASHTWMMWLGSLCMLVGIGLRTAAIASLGPAFKSDIRVDQPLIRSGIYRWLRHPSEWGLCLIAAGGPLVLSAMVTALSALIVFVPISLWRMRREDKILYI